MRAALTYGPFDMRVEDIPEPTPGPGEVKVKIAYCGICGTDPDIYDGTFGFLKAPWWPKPPFPTGHEASGIIVELGPDLVREELKVGQRVAMNFRTYCGKCYYCKSAREHMCEHVTELRGRFRRVRGLRRSGHLSAAGRGQPGARGLPRADDHLHSRRRPGEHHPRPDGGHLRRGDHRVPGAADLHAGRSGPGARVRSHAREAGAGQETGRRLDGRPPERRPGDRRAGIYRRPGLRHRLRVQRQAGGSQGVRPSCRQVRDGRLGGCLSRGGRVSLQPLLHVRQRADRALDHACALRASHEPSSFSRSWISIRCSARSCRSTTSPRRWPGARPAPPSRS